MPNVSDGLRSAVYVPHGAVPDCRGFAPAIVAWEVARRLKTVSPYVISARENYRVLFEMVQGIPVYRIHESRFCRRLFRKMTRLDPWPLHHRAATIARRVGADLVHAHQLEFPVAEFRRVMGRAPPCVVHAHAVRRYTPALGLADRYIAVSRYTRERLIEQGYPAERIEVIHNGVDTGLFVPAADEEKAAARRVLGIPPDVAVISYVARKQEAKGFYAYLKLVHKLLDARAAVFALAVGPTPADAVRDPHRAEIDALLAALKARPGFLDLPALPHARLALVYQVTDLIVAPTVFNGEQHPLAIIEPMAAGCVTLTTRIAGIVETVEHERTGLLLDDPDDPAELLARVRAVLDNLPRLAPLRAAARADVVARFDWAVITSQIESLYHRVAGRA